MKIKGTVPEKVGRAFRQPRRLTPVRGGRRQPEGRVGRKLSSENVLESP